MKKTLQYYCKSNLHKRLSKKDENGYDVYDYICVCIWLQVPVLLYILCSYLDKVVL